MTINSFTLQVASGDALDVREFSVEESLSRLFDVRLTVYSPSADVDFEAAIGRPARFEILSSTMMDGEPRYWSGICADMELVDVQESGQAGLSTYSVRVVPVMWLLTQRRNYRIFQDMSELDIALEVLQGWGIQPTLLLDAGSYPKRRMRVQYAESDFDFVNRLLEDIGVAYYFEQAGGDTALVLADCPNKNAPRAPVTFVESAVDHLAQQYVTAVHTRRQVRPGRYTQSDVDYRKPLNYPLASSAAQGNSVESQLERYHHNYGSFLWKSDGAGDTPFADDRGPARTNERAGATQVSKRLEAQRVDARIVSFRTTAHALRPGMVFTMANHPRGELAAPLLVVAATFTGNSVTEWTHTCEARYTDVDYRPPLRTPKPRTLGVESATVTGPPGEEIHTDEFGRVRVHFHWDREGADDETSSCWVPQSQPWAGAGFGATSLARVGQEVLVDFLGSDPDRPVVVGRVFTLTMPPPYALPKYKMVTGHRSESYPRPKSAPAQAVLGGGAAPSQSVVSPPTHPDPLYAPAQPVMTYPAGGGMPLVGLGGGDGSAGGAPSQDPAQALPGLRGGPQASLGDLSMTVEQLQSQGPDLLDHHRSANAIVHDDTAHKQRLYIQAQKNLYETVKNDLIGSVGGNRGFTILGNDTTKVKHYQVTEVGNDRSVAVGGDQTHFVKGEMAIQCQKNILTVTPEGAQYASANTDIVLYGKQSIVEYSDLKIQLGVGPSTITMTPDGIVIDGPDVYINPGADFMNALAQGKSLADAKNAQLAHQQAIADKIAANEKQISDLQSTNTMLAMSGGDTGIIPPDTFKTMQDNDTQITALQQQNAALKAQQ